MRSLGSQVSLGQFRTLLVEKRRKAASLGLNCLGPPREFNEGHGGGLGRTPRFVHKSAEADRRQHPYDYQQAVGPLAGRVEAPRLRCASRRLQGAAKAIARPGVALFAPRLRQTRTGYGKFTRALPGQLTDDRSGCVSAPRQAIPRQCLGGRYAGPVSPTTTFWSSRAAAIKTRSRDAPVTAT
jgi:hypothetical protein